MIKTITLDLLITIAGIDNELEVEARANVTEAIRARQHRDGSWDAPEDACVEDLEVGYFTRHGVPVKKHWHDITEFLSKQQIERIEEQLYESEL